MSLFSTYYEFFTSWNCEDQKDISDTLKSIKYCENKQHDILLEMFLIFFFFKFEIIQFAFWPKDWRKSYFKT